MTISHMKGLWCLETNGGPDLHHRNASSWSLDAVQLFPALSQRPQPTLLVEMQLPCTIPVQLHCPTNTAPPTGLNNGPDDQHRVRWTDNCDGPRGVVENSRMPSMCGRVLTDFEKLNRSGWASMRESVVMGCSSSLMMLVGVGAGVQIDDRGPPKG